jgi:hypothetical protein
MPQKFTTPKQKAKDIFDKMEVDALENQVRDGLAAGITVEEYTDNDLDIVTETEE